MMIRLRKIAGNLTLLLISSLIAIILCEFTLRWFYPRYQYAAESQFNRNDQRIWTRQPNSFEIRQHPATKESHPVYHNNWQLRQHRNFTIADLERATNIAFFGDSFTENLRIPAQYSFTEPLDYLLNQQVARVNVLNFGVDGYGTDQSFTFYQEFEHQAELDHVFYIFTANDIADIYRNNLYALSNTGELVRKPIEESQWWIKLASRFHLTYLLVDVHQRLTTGQADETGNRLRKHILVAQMQSREQLPERLVILQDWKAGAENKDFEESLAIFQEILAEWARAVEANGAKFYVVVLPIERQSIYGEVINAGIYTKLDLYTIFSQTYPNYDYQRDLRLTTDDAHWNEYGNLLTATHLYEFLASQLQLSSQPVEKNLYQYYAAFPNGWQPPIATTNIDVTERVRIRQKYLALELAD